MVQKKKARIVARGLTRGQRERFDPGDSSLKGNTFSEYPIVKLGPINVENQALLTFEKLAASCNFLFYFL